MLPSNFWCETRAVFSSNIILKIEIQEFVSHFELILVNANKPFISLKYTKKLGVSLNFELFAFIFSLRTTLFLPKI